MTEQVQAFAELFSPEARLVAATAEYQAVQNVRMVGPRIIFRAPFPLSNPRDEENWCCPVGIMLRHDGIDPQASSPTAAYVVAVLERDGKLSYVRDPGYVWRMRADLQAFMERFDGGSINTERLPELLGVPRDA
jgi:hypothetical protein